MQSLQRLSCEAEALLSELEARGMRIVTAESCTGGLLASCLTDIEGRSHCFERGFIPYSNAAKHDLLGVPRALLAECGAVSKPVATAMAQGAFDRSQASLALAITGFAGPGCEGEEEGLVHLAAYSGDALLCSELHLGRAGREPIRRAAAAAVLRLGRALLTGDARPMPAASGVNGHPIIDAR
ncbi:CinA family protein [Sphingopyxis terrae]|uniref:Nicotinamide-nucleotide amidase n=1 Tax=Sphingopyxis terrae subsp. ummariensis TaxID=429001 RepID=A0A1Y6FVD7_9SPHN|nr:nicotinamide-nucleotide amidohydrolase family protein [Sphingopyxis terrae]PCF91339.1 CinA family protein [Sphingopyxis terrae subsp. ummariensis]SMQ76513.1 nicotinamide-nucleotide amidase [Sphingopyxis terrae subsp. ummariensis]